MIFELFLLTLDSDVSTTELPPPNLDDDDDVEAAPTGPLSSFSCLIIIPPGRRLPVASVGGKLENKGNLCEFRLLEICKEVAF